MCVIRLKIVPFFSDASIGDGAAKQLHQIKLRMMQAQLSVIRLKKQLVKARAKIQNLEEQLKKLKDRDYDMRFTADMVNASGVNGLFRYYCGFEFCEFENLCQFLLVSEDTKQPAPLHLRNKSLSISLRDQLFLVLMRLRNNFDMKDLGYRFHISQPNVSIICSDWINYLFRRFAEISWWPQKSVLQSVMPEKYKEDFPNTIAIIDCTEIKIQTPSSLKVQSQCYSDYKSASTLKSLVACDSLGSVMFASKLFTGSISDKEIFVQSGFSKTLSALLECGYLEAGDGIMADKGFNIAEEVEKLGLKLNLPPFARSGMQMSLQDVEFTKKIAKHRVHVERAIGKIKKFKILSAIIKNKTLGSIDQIWYVCSMLTNFQPPLLPIPYV